LRECVGVNTVLTPLNFYRYESELAIGKELS